MGKEPVSQGNAPMCTYFVCLAGLVASLILVEPVSGQERDSRSAPAQSLSAGDSNANTVAQHFVCNTGYTQQKCNEDMAVLRKALAKYSLTRLGEWTWILVRSEDWKPVVVPRRMRSETPAFSYLEKRETFIEEALVTQVPVRSAELLLEWRMSRPDLLDFAIAHELGHALCNETDEAKTNRTARMLQEHQPFACEFKLLPSPGKIST
jgi:hypothetical protein